MELCCISKLTIKIQIYLTKLSIKAGNANTNNLFALMSCKHSPYWESVNYSKLQLEETLVMGLSAPTSSFLIYWSFEDENDLSEITFVKSCLNILNGFRNSLVQSRGSQNPVFWYPGGLTGVQIASPTLRVSDSLSLGWSLVICISNKFLGAWWSEDHILRTTGVNHVVTLL